MMMMMMKRKQVNILLNIATTSGKNQCAFVAAVASRW